MNFSMSRLSSNSCRSFLEPRSRGVRRSIRRPVSRGLSRRSSLSAAAGLTALMLCAASSSAQVPVLSSSGGPQLTLSDGESTISKLPVGDDLYVSVSETAPFTVMKIFLLDGKDNTVASLSKTSDAEGTVDSSLLWSRTGVVGCDSSSDINVLEFRFRDFEQADTLLRHRDFRVVVVQPDDSVLAEERTTVVENVGPKYFFSDQAGCPRKVYEHDEDVYFSALRSNPGLLNTAIYLVDGSDPLSADGVINEVRPEYKTSPQVLSSFFGHGDWTTPLWSGSETRAGGYGAIIGFVGGEPGYNWTDEHRAIGLLLDGLVGRGPHGITIKTWTCPTGNGGCETEIVSTH